MTAQLETKEILPKMGMDEFLEWRENREGRWELHGGVPVRLHDPAKMDSERARHARAKLGIALALKVAVAEKGLDCEVFPDGMTVMIDEGHGYEPDALLSCGDRVGDDDMLAPNPLTVVEVLSPGTAYKDVSNKLIVFL